MAYLRIQDTEAPAAESLIRSPAVIDFAVKKFPVPALSVDEHRRVLNRRLRLLPAPGDVGKTSVLFVLEVDDTNALRAQAIYTLLVDAWLGQSKLKASLENQEEQVQSISTLIGRLQEEATATVTGRKRPGEPRHVACELDRAPPPLYRIHC